MGELKPGFTISITYKKKKKKIRFFFHISKSRIFRKADLGAHTNAHRKRVKMESHANRARDSYAEQKIKRNKSSDILRPYFPM